MTNEEPRRSRRWMLKMSAVAVTLPLAGCTDDADDIDDDVDDPVTDDVDDEPEDDVDDEPDDDVDDEPEDDVDDEPEDDVDDEPDDDPDDPEFEDADYVLDGYVEGWVGVSPDEIADEENPTLEFEEGEEYTIGWTNQDGDSHNIAFRDENEEVLESTEIITEEGETQTITIVATADMVDYICEPHLGTMIGDVVVNGESDDEDDEDDEPDEEEVGVEDQPDDAAAMFVTPQDGDTVQSPVQIEAEVEGVELAPAGEPVVGEGHLHVLVNRECFEEGETIPGPSEEAEEDGIYHWGDGRSEGEIELEPGEYDLCLGLADGPHRAFGETDEITITVEEN